MSTFKQLTNGEWRGQFDALKASLGVPHVNLQWRNGRPQLQMRPRHAPSVRLSDLMGELSTLPPMTAMLGLMGDGRPLTLDFQTRAAAHALIAGNRGAGKTALLRTIAVSLALTHRQAQFQLVAIEASEASENGQESLASLNYLPHLLTPLVREATGAAEVLAFLADEAMVRLEQHTVAPAIVVLIDDVTTLLHQGEEAVLEPLKQLVQRGAAAGIHLVMATSRPVATLDHNLKARVPARLVGRVSNEHEARAAAGVSNSWAEQLPGQGHFIAVIGNSPTPFQAAYLSDNDVYRLLNYLYRLVAPVLLAQPLNGQ